MLFIPKLSDLYSICHRISKGWPPSYDHPKSPEIRHLRINSFGVIQEMSDLDADNLTKTTAHEDTTYFFSRIYDDNQKQADSLRVHYPGWFFVEDFFNLSDPLNIKSAKRKTLHKLNLLLIDKIPENPHSSDDYRSGERVPEQVSQDLQTLLAQILLTLGRFIYTKAYNGTTLLFEGFHDTQHLESLKEKNTITTYTTESHLMDSIRGIDRGEVFFDRQDNLAILATNITIETRNCHTTPTIDYPDPTNPADSPKRLEGDAS